MLWVDEQTTLSDRNAAVFPCPCMTSTYLSLATGSVLRPYFRTGRSGGGDFSPIMVPVRVSMLPWCPLLILHAFVKVMWATDAVMQPHRCSIHTALPLCQRVLPSTMSSCDVVKAGILSREPSHALSWTLMVSGIVSVVTTSSSCATFTSSSTQ